MEIITNKIIKDTTKINITSLYINDIKTTYPFITLELINKKYHKIQLNFKPTILKQIFIKFQRGFHPQTIKYTLLINESIEKVNSIVYLKAEDDVFILDLNINNNLLDLNINNNLLDLNINNNLLDLNINNNLLDLNINNNLLDLNINNNLLDLNINNNLLDLNINNSLLVFKQVEFFIETTYDHFNRLVIYEINLIK
ncbi:hypothetical protein CDIK_3245 [Cucumispora dikerogammari]|nr:hypothetical protein CDIK_3245 [Cucumispora dikerogammari]